MMKPAATSLALSTIIALTAVSCGGDGTAQQAARPDAARSIPSNNPTARQNTPRAPNAPAPAPGQTIPAGAQYSLLIHAYSSPSHILEAKNAKDALIKQTGLPDFHVVMKDGRSELCYGFYREVMPDKDAKEAARIDADKKRLLALKTATDQRMIPNVTTVALVMPDPEAPPEWDIVNSKGYWTVCIAGYTNPQTRKADAVETVRAARQMGVDAYYFHGENTSNILIGSFPETALRAQDSDRAESRDEGQDLIVSTMPLMPQEAALLRGTGRKVIAPTVDVRDPKLIETMNAYPEYALDGNVEMMQVTDPVTKKKVSRAQRSFLVEIPQVRKSWISGTRQTAEEPNAALIDPRNNNRNGGGGRLRGIGSGNNSENNSGGTTGGGAGTR